MGRTRAVLATPMVALLLAGPAAADPRPVTPVLYRPPVPGPVVDPYRPPSTPYGPGNRGLEYATSPGEPVGAPADGVVTFAGPVAGGLHVVVLHQDGIRTSLSFLAAILVVRGQRVVGGQPVARAGATLHLGARRGDAYLDPASLFADTGGGSGSILVPDDPGRPLGVEEEAAGLRRLLTGVSVRPALLAAGHLPVVGAAATVSAAEVAALVRAATVVGAPPGWAVLTATAAALADRTPCTPPASPPPPRPAGRRLLVLVGGLGSSSTAAAIFALDTAALGYAPADVVRFSYRGGTTAENPYEAPDTLAGIEPAARRLATLLTRLAATRPGQPLDVVAHSMGGLVVRAALALAPTTGAVPATVVTFGTPHGGADLAAVARLTSMSAAGRQLGEGLAVLPGGLAPASRSVADLAPGSELLSRLADAGPPGPPTRVVAVGARTDLVVPPPGARWPGVPSTTVDVALRTPLAHGALPGSPAATREVALAVAGAPPTCRSDAETLVDVAFGTAVQAGTYGVGAAAAAGLAGVPPLRPGLPASFSGREG